MVVPKVLPGADERAGEFWQAAAEGRLVVQRCGRCGTYAHPPLRACVRCHAVGGDLAFAPVSGRGTVASWIEVQRTFLDAHRDDVPYVVLSVALAEQPDVRLPAMLADGTAADLSLGAEVEVVFIDATDELGTVAVPQFWLAATRSAS